jgi:sensor histidine kinase regulating citrate/malate metabolism
VHIEPETPRSPLSTVDSVSVLGNLIDNAMDAAAEAPERWVSVVLRPAVDGGVVLEVADSGAGVPQHLREQIYDPGFSTKPAGADGRGVGLALVRSVVTDAGGSVTLRSEPTTFQVTLPGASSRRRRP